jgi:nitrogen regulatory protein PII
MVVMPRPFKDDKQLEHELREIGYRRMTVRNICSPPRFDEHQEEDHSLENHIPRRLLNRMAMQEAKIRYLIETVNQLQRRGLEQTKIVGVEEISKDEGKKLVEDYFKQHGTADIEELMINLQISVQTIVEIIDELRTEGKLVPHQDEK